MSFQPEGKEAAFKNPRRRLIAGYTSVGILGLIALVGIAILISAENNGGRGEPHIDQATGSTNGVPPDTRVGTDVPPLKVANLRKAAKRADCKLRLRLTDEGHKHLSPTAPTPSYGTNPPTSGNHTAAPYQQADGAYGSMPQEPDFIHSLEHGRLAIQYSPGLAEGAQLVLIGLYDTMYGATLLFPNDKMPFEVAATTWRNLLACNQYKGSITLDAIRAFGKATWGRYGGQPVGTFDQSAPTPIEPIAGK
jgi:hypothetical protein